MNLVLKLKLAVLAKAIAREGPALLGCVALAIKENRDDEGEDEAAGVLFALQRWGERHPDELEDAIRQGLGVDS